MLLISRMFIPRDVVGVEQSCYLDIHAASDFLPGNVHEPCAYEVRAWRAAREKADHATILQRLTLDLRLSILSFARHITKLRTLKRVRAQTIPNG